MSANDHQALVQWREALFWLAKAEADIIGARTLLAGGQAELCGYSCPAGAGEDAEDAEDASRCRGSRRAPHPRHRRLGDASADALAGPLAVTFSAGGRHPVVCHDPLPDLDASSPAVAATLEAVATLIAAVARLSPPGVAAEGGHGEGPSR